MMSRVGLLHQGFSRQLLLSITLKGVLLLAWL